MSNLEALQQSGDKCCVKYTIVGATLVNESCQTYKFWVILVNVFCQTEVLEQVW